MFKKVLSEDSLVAIILTSITCVTVAYCAKCVKDSVKAMAVTKIDPTLIDFLKSIQPNKD